MSGIPSHYASMFANIQPRKAEEISKPFDEKSKCQWNGLNLVMSLIDKEEDAPPVVQNIVLLENKPEEKEKEKDEVEIEEIMEEELENPKEQDEDMEIRKRHVKEEE